MAFIRPTVTDYDPQRELTKPGAYICECFAVKYGIKDRYDSGSKPRVAIMFRVHDMDTQGQNGQQVAIVCSETVYKNPKTGEKSHLLAHAELMGVADAENGFDPDSFIGKLYTVTTRTHDGKLYVGRAVPYVMQDATALIDGIDDASGGSKVKRGGKTPF